MKTAYKWFDYFLNLLLVSTVVATLVFIYLAMNQYTFPGNSLEMKGAVITIVMLIVFVSGLLYILFGFSIFIVNRKKDPEREKFGKRMLFKGILRSVLSFIIFFLLSLALSFFGLSQPNCLCLPKIPDGASFEVQEPDTPTFPVEDLTITDRKSYPPNISDNNWSCDLTIENKNASMSAVNIMFDYAHLKDTTDDTIPAGGTKVINVYADGNVQNICSTISITGADIVNPNTSPIPTLSLSPTLGQ